MKTIYRPVFLISILFFSTILTSIPAFTPLHVRAKNSIKNFLWHNAIVRNINHSHWSLHELHTILKNNIENKKYMPIMLNAKNCISLQPTHEHASFIQNLNTAIARYNKTLSADYLKKIEHYINQHCNHNATAPASPTLKIQATKKSLRHMLKPQYLIPALVGVGVLSAGTIFVLYKYLIAKNTRNDNTSNVPPLINTTPIPAGKKRIINRTFKDTMVASKGILSACPSEWQITINGIPLESNKSIDIDGKTITIIYTYKFSLGIITFAQGSRKIVYELPDKDTNIIEFNFWDVKNKDKNPEPVIKINGAKKISDQTLYRKLSDRFQ